MLKLATMKYTQYGNKAKKIKAGMSGVEKRYEEEKDKWKLPPSLRAVLRRENVTEEELKSMVNTVLSVNQVNDNAADVEDGDLETINDGVDEVTRRVRAAEAQREAARIDFEKEYSATATMEEEDIDLTFGQLPKNSVSEEDEENICLLCSEEVDACTCDLSPRVDVRALIGRVVPDLFE
jgi:hypothetical protein